MPRDERAFLASALLEEDKRPKTPPKGSPERQCNARCRDGHACRAPRYRRPDGQLAPRCRMHGGELGDLESQRKRLLALRGIQVRAIAGIDTKLAAIADAIARARDMG